MKHPLYLHLEFIWFFIASLWSYLHLDTIFIYICESRVPRAGETSQKIENNYGNYDDYLHTGVHARLILNTY
jgi:hypothetical protein